MTRTLGDIETGQRGYPPPAVYRCVCQAATPGKSKVKKTVMLTLTWDTGETTFEDTLFVTPKAIGRLAIVAQHVCGLSKEEELPDDDGECAVELARYIKANIVGLQALVTIEEQAEKWMPQSGPNMGKLQTKMRRRVAFAGYDAVEEEPPAEQKVETAADADKVLREREENPPPRDEDAPPDADDDLPF